MSSISQTLWIITSVTLQMVTANLLESHRTDTFIVSYIIIILKTIKCPKDSGCICFTFWGGLQSKLSELQGVQVLSCGLQM